MPLSCIRRGQLAGLAAALALLLEALTVRKARRRLIGRLRLSTLSVQGMG